MTLETLIKNAQANGLVELRISQSVGPSIQVIAVHESARSGPWTVAIHEDMATAIRFALEPDDLEDLL